MSKPRVFVLVEFALEGMGVDEAADFLEAEMSFDRWSWDKIKSNRVVSVETASERLARRIVAKGEKK